MSLLTREIEANFVAFTEQWKGELTQVMGDLAGSQANFLAAYKRLVSLNAWRDFLSSQISSGSHQFLVEGQNDALVSYVLASMGSWRSALNSLRSCLENVGFCLYYKDHPVELDLWLRGRYRIDFRPLCDYLARHPSLEKLPTATAALAILRAEYSTLSRAVHGCASFRMTGGTDATALWSSNVQGLGSWMTRQSKALIGVNLLLLAMFREHVGGTKQPGLRAAAALGIPPARYGAIRRDIQVFLSRG
jgi:hypothetical protein